MAIHLRSYLKKFFEKGQYPTAAQFADLIDSFWHKEEDSLPIAAIDKLPEVLNSKYDKIMGEELEKDVEKASEEVKEQAEKLASELKIIYTNFEEQDSTNDSFSQNITTLSEELGKLEEKKQNTESDDLNTTDKTIVGAINELANKPGGNDVIALNYATIRSVSYNGETPPEPPPTQTEIIDAYGGVVILDQLFNKINNVDVKLCADGIDVKSSVQMVAPMGEDFYQLMLEFGTMSTTLFTICLQKLNDQYTSLFTEMDGIQPDKIATKDELAKKVDITDIVSTTGNSTTKAISQKAFTDKVMGTPTIIAAGDVSGNDFDANDNAVVLNKIGNISIKLTQIDLTAMAYYKVTLIGNTKRIFPIITLIDTSPTETGTTEYVCAYVKNVTPSGFDVYTLRQLDGQIAPLPGVGFSFLVYEVG